MENRNLTVENKPSVLQLCVRLLSGKTAALQFTAPEVYGYQIKQRIFEVTKIPAQVQRLICSGYQIGDDSVVSQPDATVNLVLRLPGGKGGFGSLLRGAATKAGQKKTNNFDACRDMSGRRLRHVNAEKRLEEWRMEEEERKLEKIAEDFIKKKAKTGKKGVGDGEAHKYVEKYREVSARCVEEVDMAVREACGTSKRKAKKVESADAKRLKIWMGKRAMEGSDSDDTDSSEDEGDKENEKSIILNNDSQLDSSKDTEGSSGSVTGERQDGDISAGASSDTGSEEDKEGGDVPKTSELHGCSVFDAANAHMEENDVTEHSIQKEKVAPSTEMVSTEVVTRSGTETFESVNQKQETPTFNNPVEEVSCQPSNISSSENNAGVDTSAEANDVEPEKPLNFDEFSSAAELEVLGMERLKSELQTRGLKCGGTLQERAARLFLLKSTPIEKIPKKLLAKK